MLSKKDVLELLAARFANDAHKSLSQLPLPSKLKDNYKAANRIKQALENDEKIAIVGDYDVDGVVSSAVLSEFFADVGANAIVRIPNRFKDGYGLNEAIIDELADSNLIITVDNGISANEAAEVCAARGIELIVTDHHMPPAILPRAYAIVNPKQEDCPFPPVEICGAQVAWYLVGALKDVLGLKNYDMGKFLDLLALAIIADMMELRDMNRALVRAGLARINESRRACFRAIRDFYGKEKFEFDDISFLIAPLVNSAGRMDDATVSYRFLTEKKLEIANKLLYTIIDFNNSRKEKEKILFESSIKDVRENDDIIVTWGESWHEGVIGIVASRLAKRFKKPAIVFSVQGESAKGSARSVGKIDVLSLIASQEALLEGYGGHKGAAGLVIKAARLPEFREAINAASVSNLNSENGETEDVLGSLDPCAVDMEFLGILERFEPYGQKNPRPVFKFENMRVAGTRTIGNDEAHLKLTLKFENDNRDVTLEGVFFNFDFRPHIGERISLLASVTKNTFRGALSAQLLVKEIYPQG